jgi:large subunit ribosomal protein L15
MTTLQIVWLLKEIVKILGRGELKAKLSSNCSQFTTAKAAIEAAGGEAVII